MKLPLSPLKLTHNCARQRDGSARAKTFSKGTRWLAANVIAGMFLCAAAALILSGCQPSQAKNNKTASLHQAQPIPVKVEQPIPPKIVQPTPTPIQTPPRIQPSVAAVVPPAPAIVKTNQTPPVHVATAKPLSVVPSEPPLTNLPVAPDFRWKQVPNSGHYIALTFDDGPNPKNTPAMLDILKKRNIPATFFVLGQNAALYPRILERMVAEGHEIGSHAWNHISLVNQTAEERTFQVRKTNEAIERATKRPARLIRPPYGETTPSLNRWLTEQLKMTVILWSVDSRDWEHRDAASMRREILSATKPGAVILAHDIHQTTVSAMPAILDALIEKGYKFVTVSDLIRHQSGK